MGKRVQFRRVFWLAMLLAIAFAGLGYRLVDIQVLRHEKLSAEAVKNTRRSFLFEPRRGDILDVKGNQLATSQFVKTVFADPSLIGDRQADVAKAIAPILQMPETEICRLLVAKTSTNAAGTVLTHKYVRLKRKVLPETWQKVQSAMASLSFGVDETKLTKTEQQFYRQLRQRAIGVDPVDSQIRVYPGQRLASHVLGYVATQEREANGVKLTEIVGTNGIERSFDRKLAGARGWRLTEIDRREREVPAFRDQDVEAEDGLNVVLTIDSVIQHIVESELAEAMAKHSPISISSVVTRPRTGEILAMATLPDYDPNDLSSARPEAMRNRVITDVAEPGSTFKIVVVSGALNDNIVQPNEVFDCENGHFHYANRILHDHEPAGRLTVEGIITHSSNIGAAKVGIKMGEKRLYDYMRRFGIGQRTDIPLPGEVWGILNSVSNWTKVSIAQIPMGQGVSTTPLQMVMAMSAIANNGVLMRPMIVDHLEDGDRHVMVKYEPQRVRQVISETTAKQMVAALKTVVTPEGTAAGAILDHYTVAGKTGTAWKVENGAYVRKYFSSFIGFFPADNPEVCISVVMDEPKNGIYGGKVAAPVFKQIAERAANYLNIRPEDGDKPFLPDSIAGTPPLKTAARLP